MLRRNCTAVLLIDSADLPAAGQAAKRMYVAVDAVLGHVASNGAAPLPKTKVKFVRQTLDEVENFLEQGK
jgi:hypothetical protein